jgi:acyl carrier protein
LIVEKRLGSGELMGLDSVEIVMEAERLFNIELPDEAVSEIYTFGAFVDCVYGTTLALGRKITRRETEETLKKMVADHLGIKPDVIKFESRFVDDLGMQ